MLFCVVGGYDVTSAPSQLTTLTEKGGIIIECSRLLYADGQDYTKTK